MHPPSLIKWVTVLMFIWIAVIFSTGLWPILAEYDFSEVHWMLCYFINTLSYIHVLQNDTRNNAPAWNGTNWQELVS